MKLLKYFQKTKNISRKEFLEMIKDKAVIVNGSLVDNINYEINYWDKLEVKLPDGNVYKEEIKKLPNYKPVIVLFNKPVWYVVSKNDPHNKTIFDILPSSWKKDFYYVWRLDKNSRWLLLLTNEPEIVDKFANPRNKVVKIYNVQIDKPFKTSDINRVKRWIYVDQQWNQLSHKVLEKMKSMSKDQKDNFLKKNFVWKIEFLSFKDVTYFKTNKWKHFLKIVLTEWKKRHIRRLLKAIWYKVLDLQRIKFWKYKLWNIKEGKYKIVKI